MFEEDFKDSSDNEDKDKKIREFAEIVRCLFQKDIFFQYYVKFLSKRLLIGTNK